MNRLLSIIIVLSMILCMLPTYSLAQTDIIAECNIADGATNVSNPDLTEKVTVAFNQPMDPATLNANNVLLSGGDYVTQYTVADDNESISYDISYLRPHTKYTLTLKSGIETADGTAFGEDKILATFTTGDVYIAQGDEISKIQNVSVNKKITTPDGMASDSHKIEWLVDGVSGNMPQLTKDLDEDGRRSFTIDLEEAYTIKAVDLSLHNGYQGYNNWKIYGHNTENAAVEEMTLLADTTGVNVTYKSGVGGYRIFLDNAETFRYVTCSRGGSVYTYEVSVWAGIPEEELPIEAECNINDGEENVENPTLTEKVTVTFNQPMDESTLNSNYVLLNEKDWTRIAQYEVNEELTEISFGMEYLNPGKTYTVKVKNGIKNEDGKALEEPIELCTFTTGNIIVDETADDEKLTNVSLNKTVTTEGTGDASIITDGAQGYRFDGTDEDKESTAHFTIDLEDSYNVKAADMVLHGGYGGFNYWTVYGHNEPDADISEMTELAQTPHQWITHASEGATYRIFFDNNDEYRYITFVRASNSFWIYECTVWANALEQTQEPDVPGGDNGDDNNGDDNNGDDNNDDDTPVTPPAPQDVKIVMPVNDAEYISNGGTASMTSPTGHKLLLCKSGAYITWSVDIPRDGVYLISFFSAYRGSNPRVTTHIDTGDGNGFVKLGEQEIIQGATIYTAMENPVSAVALKKGTIKVKLTESYYEAFMSDLVLTTYENFELTEVKAGKRVLEDGDTIERSTDFLDITFNRNINPETAYGVSITANDVAIKTTAEATDNVVRVYLNETLDYGKEYGLKLAGVKDIYNVYEINETFAKYSTNSEDGSEVFKSKGVESTKADIDYNAATVTGTALSSEGKPIKGRNVQMYLKDTKGQITEQPVAKTLSADDGKFTINYTIPESSDSGVYTFIIKAEYSDFSTEETVIYVSKTKETEIVSSFAGATDWEAAENVIDEYKEMLNISPAEELTNIPDKTLFYRHFAKMKYSNFKNFIDHYNRMIAFETLNQATTSETVKIILDSEASCEELGVDKSITDCVKVNRDAFLNELAQVGIFSTENEYLVEFERVLNKYLSMEFGKSQPVAVFENYQISTGEGIALELRFEDYVTDAKEFVYEFTDVNNSKLFDKAYATLNIKGTYELTNDGTAYTLKIVPDTIISKTNNIGKLYLTAGNSTGNYTLNINGYVVHSVRRDYGNGTQRYESTNVIQPASVFVNVIKSNQSSSGMVSSTTPIPGMSSSSGGGGGGGISGGTSTPVVTPPVQDTEYTFGDLPGGHWAEDSVNSLVKMGVISKPEDKQFNPDKEVSREEFIKMAVVAFDIWDKDITGDSFADVTIDNWYYSYVYSARKHGIITGNGLGFGAGEKITREDMSVILSRIMSIKGITAEYDGEAFADTADISDYAQTAVYTMKKLGIINGMGDNLFVPRGSATRAMAAKVIWELKKLTDNN